MDSGTIALIISIVGSIIGVLSFVKNGSKSTMQDGERWGRLDANNERIRDDLKDIKKAIDENATTSKESIRRVHDRIDDHLRQEHNMSIPKIKD